MPAMPTIRYEVDLDSPPGSNTRIWTDISAHVLPGWKVVRGTPPPSYSVKPGELLLPVRNTAGRFDPTNATGPYAGKLLPLRPIRISLRKPDLSWATRFTGLVLDWPQAWRKHGRYGYAEIPCTDATLAFGGYQFGDRWDDAISDARPQHWYRMDPFTSVYAPNSGSVQDGQPTPTIGAGGYVAGLVLGNPSQSLELNHSGGGNNTALTIPNFSVAPDFITLQVLFQISSVGANPASRVLTVIGAFDLDKASIRVITNGAGALRYELRYLDATSTPVLVDLGAATVGEVRLWTMTWTTTALTVWRDGVQVANITSNLSGRGTIVSVKFGESTGAIIGQPNDRTISYRTDEILLFDYTPTTAAVARQYQIARANGGTRFAEFGQQSSSARITQILDTVGWPSTARVIDSGGITLLPTGSVKKRSAEQLLSETAAAELGQVFLTGDGRVAFHTRAHRDALTTPSYTFGEDTAAGELPYTSDLLINYDWRDIVNSAELTIDGGPSGAIPYAASAEDSTSIDRYFRRSYPGMTAFPYANTADLDATAARIVARGKDPHARLDRITVDPLAYPGLWPFVYDAEIGMLIRVRRRSPGAPLIQLDCFIEQITEQQGLDLYRLELTLSPKL